MFPTTLSAMGATIKGDRLGLGTDLFSSTPTLCEELGVEEYKKQLEMSNNWVNSQ
jgi:phosphoglycerol transferase